MRGSTTLRGRCRAGAATRWRSLSSRDGTRRRRLPGEIRVEPGNVRFYIPLVPMLLVPVAATLLLAVVRHRFRC
ncbi:DUF2905 domain-containing protein [Mycobacterium sp. Lab-001]|uniref:DUF2905 domain-containing protein n=1 Tax=Mycobacterium sp. Lab-001 TaxID=3410136 RepID=UPI003D184592